MNFIPKSAHKYTINIEIVEVTFNCNISECWSNWSAVECSDGRNFNCRNEAKSID